MSAKIRMTGIGAIVLAHLQIFATGAAWGQASAQIQPTQSKQAELTGRLFFSQEQRQSLELARKSGTGQADRYEWDTLHYNGAIIRSSGKNTYWVNGTRITKARPDAQLKFDTRTGNAEVSMSDGTRTQVKPGTSFERKGETANGKTPPPLRTE